MHRRTVWLLAAALAASCLVMQAGVASASWSVKPPAATGLDRALAVSCSSASACTAVGDAVPVGDEAPNVSLAERWNGSAWRTQPLPRPAGATAEQLTGVSCPSASACIAVGFFIEGSLRPLALRWNGTSEAGPVGWSLQEIPTPAGATATSINAVSCTSASECTAIGFYLDSSFRNRALAYRWDGRNWTIQEAPDPTENDQLYGISCSSATACTAVGYDIASAAAPLIETWDGRAWTTQTAAIPAGSISTTLAGVSCTSTSACTAVGTWSESLRSHTLAERWDGSRWTVQATPDVEFQNRLRSVSCTSATACTAAGEGSGEHELLVEQWNGGGWALQALPEPGVGTRTLNAVSCTSSTACMTGGEVHTSEAAVRTVEEQLSGTTWSVTATPVAGTDRLRADACTEAADCTAVGDATPLGSSIHGVLAERWDGSAWSTVEVGLLEGAVGGRLFGVSCFEGVRCVAVGDSTEASSGVRSALAEVPAHRGTLRPEAVPEPEGATSASLRGVSCAGESACTAVGSAVVGGVTTPFAARWNGGEWALQSTPSPAEAAGAQLAGVACPSASACVAVGTWRTREGRALPLVERWNGTEWALQRPALPAEAGAVRLRGVACSEASACTAVGTYATRAGPRTLAERWNGSAWSVQSAPNVEGGNVLAGVSCSSATSCTAVGHGAGRDEALVERWSGGEWALEEAVSPGEASQLLGVACTSEAACMAGGAFETETGLGLHPVRSLAEQRE